MPNIERDNAFKNGDMFYATGKPCRRGHIADRYTSSGNCTECMIIYTSTQRAKNKNRRIQYVIQRSNDSQGYSRFVGIEWHGLLDNVLAVIRNGTPDSVERCRDQLAAIGNLPQASAVRVPPPPPASRVGLDRQAFTRVAQLRPGSLTQIDNLAHFDTTIDIYPEPYTPAMYLCGEWYAVDDLAALLRGDVFSIPPTTPAPASLPVTMKGIIK